MFFWVVYPSEKNKTNRPRMGFLKYQNDTKDLHKAELSVKGLVRFPLRGTLLSV